MNTWKELDKAYPMDRDEMTKEQEREFVNYCFDLYEKEGFSKIFWAQGGDFPELIGKPFTVVGRETEDRIYLSYLPMWRIHFENGTEISAYPDEIIPREMRENGCEIEGLE